MLRLLPLCLHRGAPLPSVPDLPAVPIAFRWNPVVRSRPQEWPLSTCAVTRRRFSSGCKPRPAIAPAGSNREGMEETKCLKPPDSGHEFGDRASVQAATQVNAEQSSHDAVQVKGVHQVSIDESPVASASQV